MDSYIKRAAQLGSEKLIGLLSRLQDKAVSRWNSSDSRLQILLFLSVWVSSFCFIGYLDMAPTGIFSNPAIEYQAKTIPPDGSYDIALNVSSSADLYGKGVNGGLDIPPSQSFTSPFNVLVIVLVSIIPAVYVSSLYNKYKKFDVGGLRTYIVIASVFGYILMYAYLVRYNDVSLSPPSRWIGIVVHVVFIVLLLIVYTKPTDSFLTGKSNSEKSGIYVRSLWRRIRLFLFVGFTISFGGAVTFATTTVAGPLAIVIFSGIFISPLAGCAAFYYSRLREVERNLNLR